jgi:hypothetical protein
MTNKHLYVLIPSLRQKPESSPQFFLVLIPSLPAKAGVQSSVYLRTISTLDAGIHRHDEKIYFFVLLIRHPGENRGPVCHAKKPGYRLSPV